MFTDESEKKKTGRAFMIAIPIAALLGGIATPVGSTMNLLAMDLLEQHTGQTISFVQWMSIGVPIVLLIFPVAWLLVYKIYKPAEINPEMVNAFISKLNVPKKISVAEKKVIFIFSCMIALWVLSSWVRQIDITIVALIGACCMFMPGIEVLQWKQFIKNVNFDVIFLVGTVLCLGLALGRNGVSDWIAMSFLSLQMSLPLLIAFTVTIVFLILIIMPVGPSVVIFLAAPLIALAQSLDVNPALIMLSLAMAAGNCYLLPLDTIPLITYGSGYYSMLDMPKSTLPLQVYVVIIMTLVLPFFSNVLQVI
jgi:sodium-dependent dicarboxylate transporter 2/3/5